MNEPRHCLGCTGWHLGPIAASIAADTVETHEPCPGLSDNTEAVERRLEEVSRAANLFHEFKDVRVMWANGEVCDSCSHALCARIRIAEAERDRLWAELAAAQREAKIANIKANQLHEFCPDHRDKQQGNHP